MDIRSRLGGHLHGDDPPPKTIVKPTALSPVANTDTKLLIYGLFQKGRVLAQDGVGHRWRTTRVTLPRWLFPEADSGPRLSRTPSDVRDGGAPIGKLG